VDGEEFTFLELDRSFYDVIAVEKDISSIDLSC
jgi:hypothetical protein